MVGRCISNEILNMNFSLFHGADNIILYHSVLKWYAVADLNVEKNSKRNLKPLIQGMLILIEKQQTRI